jgi:hypothetical protein
MDVKTFEDEKIINLDLSDDSDWTLFQMIANELVGTFKIQWKTQADGLDQRYWDFEYKAVTFTLHLEHYLGISIFADKSKVDIEITRQAINEIKDYFETWNPPA